MKIGLLSDTHSFLDPNILDFFSGCDEVWHAGDIGDPLIITKLEEFRPLRAVYGNIDAPEIRHRFPEDLQFDCEGMNVWITHIAGTPPRYNPRIKKKLKGYTPDLLICGHSHILKVMRDPEHNNLIFMNPGAAGNHGFHSMKTILRFEIKNGVLANLEVIELGKRGAIPSGGKETEA